MPAAPLPPDEAARLAALHRLGVLDTPPEPEFDDLARLAATICGTPIALVSLVDADRQWFKARVGLDPCETHRDLAFCAHALHGPDLFEVPDAAADPRFRDNPLVTGEPGIRFYAGVPLAVPDGHRLGTLCVIDVIPRTLTAAQRDGLQVLARQVTAHFRLRRQGAELRAGEERFRLVWESSAEGMRLVDADGTVVHANPAYCRLVGRPAAEVVGRPLSAAFAAAGRADALAKHRRRFATRTVRRQAESAVELWDGSRHWFEVGDAYLELPGEPTLLLTVFRDVTARKTAEDARQESEVRFRAFMDNSPAVAYMVDEAGRVVYINEPMKRQFGITDADWMGKDEYERFPADIARDMQEKNRAVLAGGKPVVVQEHTPAPDGTLHVWQSYKFPLTDAAGRRLLGGLAINVTAEKRAEDALRASEEQYRSLAEGTGDLVHSLGRDGTIQYVNAAWQALLGYAAAEVVGRSVLDFVYPDDRAYATGVLRRLLSGEEVGRVEGRVVTKAGETRWVEGTATVRVEDGRPAGTWTIYRDVTARKAAEDALRDSEERYRDLFENTTDLVQSVAPDGGILYVNAAWRAALGYTEAEARDLNVFQVVHPDDQPHCGAVFHRLLAGEEVGRVETRFVAKSGRVFWVEGATTCRFADGRAVATRSIFRDVTARRTAEDALRDSEAKFRNTVDRLAEGLFVVDVATGRFAEANAAVLDMLGYTLAEFVALDPFDIVYAEDRAAYERNVAAMRDRLDRDGRFDLCRKELRRKDGAAVPVDLKVTAVPNGGAGLHAVIVRDVTAELRHEAVLFEYQVELEAANAKLRAQATTDRLTGVGNRAAFDERLAEAFERSRRTGRPLSLVLLDVDHFKLFNDTFGHPAGDGVLQAVAGRLAEAARGTDVVARYGGEEFAVILPDTDYTGAMVLAERCRRAVAAAGWEHRPVTVSVGVATLAPDTGPADLVREADQALYRSKQAGRNRVSHGSGSIGMAALAR